MNLLKLGRHFNVKVRIYYFFQFTKGVMNFFFFNGKKKGGQKKQIHHDEKRKKKMNTWGEFCRLEEF